MGHYCIICGRTRPNEKFSGKGHRRHICKDCSGKPKNRPVKRIPSSPIPMLDDDENLDRPVYRESSPCCDDEELPF